MTQNAQQSLLFTTKCIHHFPETVHSRAAAQLSSRHTSPDAALYRTPESTAFDPRRPVKMHNPVVSAFVELDGLFGLLFGIVPFCPLVWLRGRGFTVADNLRR